MENRLPCIYLRRFGRRVPAAARSGVSRARSFRAHLFTRRGCSPAAIRRSRPCSARATAGGALYPGHVRRKHHRQRPGDDFPRRSASGGKAATGEVVSAEDLGGGR